MIANSCRKRLPDYGVWRNCNLFDYLSTWAYKAIRQGWPEYERWLEACLTRAEGYNKKTFKEPLPQSEIKATAKSVARWTHKNFSAAGFSEWQAKQGAKGGKVSKRPTSNGKSKSELQPVVLRLKEQGYSNRDIAQDLGISASTVSLYLKM